jgi:uncharacterized membrane protein YgcG
MKCPSCRAVVDAPVPRCPACKLSLQRLDVKFGMVPRHSRYLTDRSGRLSLNEMEQLRASLRLFEKKFPQILFSVFIDNFPPDTSTSEFAFWMANRARFSSIEQQEGENFDLLLVLDLATGSAALTSGYGLETSVSEQHLEEALEALAGPLRQGDIAGGVRALLEVLTRRLRESSKRPGAAEPSTNELAHAE